jgi:hypothetical protein
MRLIAILFLASSLVCRAADSPAARWEGTVQIPGRDLKLIVDLAAAADGGAWIGSITIPGLNVKGATLSDIVIKGANISFTIKDALCGPRVSPATIKALLTAKGTLAGEFQQGGNHAPFVLEKSGPAQVDAPKRSTAISTELAGEWKGKYELGGYPRDVSLKLGNQAGVALVDFVIVGKKVNNLPVTLTRQDGDFLYIEAPSLGITYEGRLRRESGEIQGTLVQGPFELPLTLRRNP